MSSETNQYGYLKLTAWENYGKRRRIHNKQIAEPTEKCRKHWCVPFEFACVAAVAMHGFFMAINPDAIIVLGLLLLLVVVLFSIYFTEVEQRRFYGGCVRAFAHKRKSQKDCV